MSELKEFAFKDLDQEGLETLQAISEADAFNQWMYDSIKPFLSGKILEIGSGIGNISRPVLKNGYSIMLSDIRDNYCDYLRENFTAHTNLLGIKKIDLIHPEFTKEYSDLISTFDTVFALNVVEHIKDDVLAFANSLQLLKTGGKLVILVPAHQWLYNKMDKELYHYRRYSLKTLKRRIMEAGGHPVRSFYFNSLGIGGWLLNGVINKKIISGGQMSAFNKLVPLAKVLDKFTNTFTGLSSVVVARKPA
jgi:2-polyprenyl-3-methyl-5-hydroxy-6-metoxy-1,4-benzoquinol methylase